MAEYIERTKAISKVKRRKFSGKTLAGHELSFNDGVFETITVLESIPAADVRPERHGYWIPIFDNAADEKRGVAMKYKCSECANTAKDETYSHAMDYEFCPHCGAKMDGKDGNK